ncbi:MAG: WD40 repeat domain-containing protein [Candidatus Sericytochromatia bacterium]
MINRILIFFFITLLVSCSINSGYVGKNFSNSVISHDGKYIITGKDNIKYYDFETGNKVKEIDGDFGIIKEQTFYKKKSRYDQGEPYKENVFYMGISSLNISPNGKYISVCAYNNKCFIYNANTYEIVLNLKIQENEDKLMEHTKIIFSNDSNKAYFLHYSSFEIWDIITQRNILKDNLNTLNFFPFNDKLLAIYEEEKNTKLYIFKDNIKSQIIKENKNIRDISILKISDNKIYAIANEIKDPNYVSKTDESIIIFDENTFDVLKIFNLGILNNNIHTYSLTRDQNYLILASSEGHKNHVISIYEVNTGKLINSKKINSYYIKSLYFHPLSNKFIAQSPAEIMIFDYPNLNLINTFY